MSSKVAPLEASIAIEASPREVWRVVADQRRMKEWSPELVGQVFSSKVLRRGTLSFNLNKRKGFIWPTASRITCFEPERRIAFHVYGPAAEWSYELAENPSGTTLIERRRLKDSKRTILSKFTAAVALGGIEGHDHELLEGMVKTLEAIKAVAEAES